MNATTPARPPLGIARAAQLRQIIARAIATGEVVLSRIDGSLHLDAMPAVRPHPSGGYTLAVPVAGTITARTYVGQFDTPGAARAAAFAFARSRGRVEAYQLQANAGLRRAS